ncbi:MAG TPA: hypothetical protein DEO89_07650, partial [Lachnospiraceae bacterium]|nr:hypothetical protein [Lachnospiraceae bacterium]
MGKRGKRRLAVGVILVVLILSGFVKKELKEQVKKSTGELFCGFLMRQVDKIWSAEILSLPPLGKKNQVAKVEYDPAKLQQENESMLQEENGSYETQGLQEDTVVQSEKAAVVPAAETMKNTGSEAYVKKLWETKDVNYLWDHFYIVDSTTSVRKKLFPVEHLLKRNMCLKPKKGKKQILIYHTHGASEAFVDSRSGKTEDGVIGVGEVLKKELEKNGYETIHDTTKYDWMDGRIDRSKAYNVSLEGVQRQLEQNPDIQVLIDLHRDSVGKNKHTYTTIN